MTIEEQIKDIKQSFRLYMNGPGSMSMREKGLNYHVNWGVPLPTLREMAETYGKNYELAIALYKDNVRECKLLATLLMPIDRMDAELADVWLEQDQTQEVVEMLAMNVFQYADFASVLAYECIASEEVLRQICGYNILSRLFGKQMEPNERGINEFLDQASVAFSTENLGVKHAALNAVMSFAALGQDYENIARKALQGIIEI